LKNNYKHTNQTFALTSSNTHSEILFSTENRELEKMPPLVKSYLSFPILSALHPIPATAQFFDY
jgi:hypothetical protein